MKDLARVGNPGFRYKTAEDLSAQVTVSTLPPSSEFSSLTDCDVNRMSQVKVPNSRALILLTVKGELGQVIHSSQYLSLELHDHYSLSSHTDMKLGSFASPLIAVRHSL